MRATLAARLQRVTLRRRLIAILLGLLLVSCAVVAAATALLLHAYLLSKLDQQLASAGARYSIALEHTGDGDLADSGFASVLGQPSGTLGARILAGRVTAIGIIGGGTEHPVPSASDRAAIAALGASSSPRTVHLPRLGEYRVVVTHGRDGDLLVTGLPEHSLDDTTRHLVLVELTVFAGAILITGVTGALSIRRSLRPLEQVTHMARRVSDLPLGTGTVSMPDRVPNPAPETEVGQVADAVNHMLAHVEAALAQRHSSEERLRSFIADASHELRTPVAVIRSHADYAQRTNPSLPPETDQALQRIGAEAARMGRLVDDLLLLARLDAGQELLDEEVDLTRIVLDTVADAQLTGPEHRWELDLPAQPVTGPGDAHRLHQALANLLTNASTHAPPGTTVKVELSEDVSPGKVEIRVRDNGPGISPEVAPHVLKRFVRGDDARSKISSSAGLGLSIVAAIVAAHGGTFGLTSEPGRTEFWIRLPAGEC